MTWPTPHPGAAGGEGHAVWAQPTATGQPDSALFGCVRNDGNRFHEGIDIAPYQRRDGRGEATDPIFAALDGVVVHVNRNAGNSGYGRYVVLEHPQFRPAFYTLYAHLAQVGEGIEPGMRLEAGGRLGRMGRSAGGYTIPRDRAHLHFEVGLRLSDAFQSWYDRQKFGSRNHHGNYNGLNLAGFDPLAAFNWLRQNNGQSVEDYFRTIPVAAIVEVVTPATPDFARRYPSLVRGGSVPAEVAGWRLSVSGFGVPLALEPLAEVPGGSSPGDAIVAAVDPGELQRFGCRKLVELQANGSARLGSGGRQLLELLFGFH